MIARADRDGGAQQIGESNAAFAAFVIYRDLDPARRSGRTVAQAVGKAESLVWRWCRRWAWVARAHDHDAAIDARARAAATKQIVEFRARAAVQTRAKIQSLLLPDVAISARIEKARGTGQDLAALFADVSMHDLVLLAIHAGRVLPSLLKAEGDALGVPAIAEPDGPRRPDLFTDRIQASDELRSLAALIIERASAETGADPAAGGVLDPPRRREEP